MKKPSEKQIEQYVRYPEELSEKEKDWIETILKTDEELKLIAEWFRRFYVILDEVDLDDDQLYPNEKHHPSVIFLKPLKSAINNGRRNFILAAQTDGAETTNMIEQIRTFASKKYGTVVRVLNLKSRKTTKIDVISDLIADDEIVILSASGSNVNLVTEPGGKIEISSSEISKNDVKGWESCRVRLPVLKSKADRASSERDGYLLAKSPSSDQLKSIEIIQKETNVEIYPDQTQKKNDLNYLVLSEKGQESTLWELKNGKAIVPNPHFRSKDVTLFFYS